MDLEHHLGSLWANKFLSNWSPHHMVGTRNTLQFILVKTTIFYKSNCRHKGDSWWTQDPSQKNMQSISIDVDQIDIVWEMDGFFWSLQIPYFLICFSLFCLLFVFGSYLMIFAGAAFSWGTQEQTGFSYMQDKDLNPCTLSDYVDFTKTVLRAQYTMSRWSRTWPENFPFLAYFPLSKMPWGFEGQNVKATLKFFPF